MITSRPQTLNLFSFVLFLIIAWVLVVINFLSIVNDPQPPWFNYAVVVVLAPIALFISYKVIFRYKIVNVGNGTIEIYYPQFGKRKSYSLKEVRSWKETIIRTGKKSTYKEVEIAFSDNRRITLAWKEYTDYERIIQYLKLKLPAAAIK